MWAWQRCLIFGGKSVLPPWVTTWFRSIGTGHGHILHPAAAAVPLGDCAYHCLYAQVMPENRYSARTLVKNGFLWEADPAQGRNWGGEDAVMLDVYKCDRDMCLYMKGDSHE